MLKNENFTKSHILNLKEGQKTDISILERAIYAHGLLEALVRVGLPFIFKGGTCLMLLLENPRRLSTDVDIIVPPDTDILEYIDKAAELFPFKNKEEQTRIGDNNIVKKHFKFYYDSPTTNKEFYILLDVLFEENNYAKTIQREIKNSLLLTEEPMLQVITPTVDCILGDKLTAFAPHTTGIPFGKEKELEIIKQLFDVTTLIETHDTFQDVYTSYINTVKAELAYRGNKNTIEEAIMDTINTAACVISKGYLNKEEYPLLMSGIRGLKTHLFHDNYSGEIASIMSGKVMYMGACLLTNTKFNKDIGQKDYFEETLPPDSPYKRLEKIKKIDNEAYGYIVEAVRLIEQYTT